MTIYRCTALGVLPSGRAWSIRMHFVSGNSLASVEASWLTAMTAAWSTIGNPLKALYPSGVVLETTKTESLAVVAVTGVNPHNALRSTGVQEDNPAIAGTSANPSMNDNDAIVVSFRSTTPGREGRGRVRLPGPDRTLVTASEIDATTAGHITTAFDGVLTSMASAGAAAAIVTYKLTKTNTAVGSTRSITFAETDRVIRSARGRSRRRKAVFV